MSNHADHFLVCLPLGFVHLLRQQFYQIKGMAETIVQERQAAAPVNVRIVQTHGPYLVHRQSLQSIFQVKIAFVQCLAARRLKGNAQETFCRRIHGGDSPVQVQDEDTHRRRMGYQVEQLVLPPHMQTLGLQAFHHTVEYLDDAIGIILPDRTQP